MNAKPTHAARHHYISKNRGFSLIEVLVVLVIAGIVASAGYASYSALVGSSSARSDASSLASLFNYARSQAILRNQPVTITTTGNWSGVKTVTVNGNQIRSVNPGFATVTATSSLATTTVVFDNRGRITPRTARTFTFCSQLDTDQGVQLTINTMGRVSSAVITCP